MPGKIKRKNNNKKFAFLGGAIFLVIICFSLDRIERLCLAFLDDFAKFIGFYIKDINITGTSSSTATLIRNKLGVFRNENTFKLSTREIYNNVLKVSWVKSAIVQKNLPNVINIRVKERIPIAIFQHDSIFTLVDEDGAFIEDVTERPEEFPIVYGENANKKAKDILAAISKFEFIKGKLESLTLIRNRRWDLMISGIKIKLPEQDIDKALETLSDVLKNNQLNKNTAKIIDLRTPNDIIVNGLKLRSKNKVIVHTNPT